MKLTEDKIRELSIKANSELGPNASPDAVKKLVEEKIRSSNDFPEGEMNLSSGRVILTSFGLNTTGIVSSISAALSEAQCDILDISQKIMQEFFTMIMMIDITNSPKDIKDLQEIMKSIAERLKVKIYLQHEDVFRFMHRI
ncbi:MAG: ACT domain-containing protein [Ignavibacteria bacterium]|nr:ACT domain-containing protein [Ignavibacteria bacterium]